MAIIDIRHLRKSYGGTVAVEDVSLTVERGEVFGIIGPNGAGKTTTVESITGLRPYDSGTIRVLGVDPHTNRSMLRKRVGVQLQQCELPGKIRVGEAIDLYSSFYADPADPAALLDELGLGAKRKATFGTLSGGERQRLSIALALVGKPEIAVLDELTTGLDPRARHDTWEVIERVRDRGVTIVLVTHFMDEVERLCDRIAVIDAGKVVALDTPAGFVESTELQQRITFRPSRAFDDQLLTALPEVAGVRSDGAFVVVTGTGDLLAAVIGALAPEGVRAHELHATQPSLDEAFVQHTGHFLRNPTEL